MSVEAVDDGKLFVGGLSWDTSEEGLRNYFSPFGEVREVSIKMDKTTKRPRGFGFVTFCEPMCAKKVLEHKEEHHLDGKKIDPKEALAKSDSMVGGPSYSENKENPNKVFIGGIPPLGREFVDTTDYQAAIEELKEEVKQALEQLTYPNPVAVKDVEIKVDANSLKHKGFAFATFPTEESARLVCGKQFFQLRGKTVEIKKAEPRPPKYSRAGGGMGGGYQQYQQQAGAYSHYDTSQTAAQQGGYNPYYGGYYPQSSSTSYNTQPSTNTGSHVNYDYSSYGGASRGETAAGSYGQTYPQSYSYGAGASGQGMQHHGYPPNPASYGTQQHQQQSNYYQSHGMHHAT